jgi:predicted outer membrane repeat protein
MNGVSRITGNTATGGQGGGVYSEPESTVTMNDSSSITGNTPDDCFPLGSCQ